MTAGTSIIVRYAGPRSRSVSSRIGSSGCVRRFSTFTNETSSTALRTNEPSVTDPAAVFGETDEAVDQTAESAGDQRGAGDVEASAVTRWLGHEARRQGRMMAMPMGTLMNITHRHDTHEVSAPPRISPSDPPPADTAVKMPSALLRAGPSSKVALMRLSVLGAAIAAPTPWTARVSSNMVDGRRHAAEQRRGGEDRESDDEHSASTEDVAGPSTEEQESAEGQAVGVDDPRETGRAEVQGVLDRYEGDVDDGGVEDDHQLTGDDDG